MAVWVISVLAIWRLSYMLTEQDGPLDIFLHTRVIVNRWQYVVLDDRKIFNFLCIHCLSVWVALPFAFVCADGWWIFPAWMALSAGASFTAEAFVLLEEMATWER